MAAHSGEMGMRQVAGDRVRRLRAFAATVLERFEVLRRILTDLVRIEVFDRSMVIAAQALLALLPLVVVLIAFLPAEVLDAGLDRFAAATGLDRSTATSATNQTSVAMDTERLRTQTGAVGLVVVLLSASSFARAVQRMYEKAFDLVHLGGWRGRGRCVGWLVGWLVAMELLSLLSALATWGRSAALPVVLDPLWSLPQLLASCVVWGWTMHTLLFGRVAWPRLVLPAVLTGTVLTLYSTASGVVMGPYAESSARQFGAYGLVLAIASWLVGFAAVLVVCAVVGRAVSEDPTLGGVWRRLRATLARQVRA